jgi:hypothetical protein
MTQPDEYPESWRPRGAPKPQPETPTAAAEAVALAVEQYISSLTEAQAADLWARSRPEGMR